MYLMAKKKSYIPLVSEIIQKNSLIYTCKHKSSKCLRLFIKTRYHQPNICLACLQELNKVNNYPMLQLQKNRLFNKKAIL